MRSTGIGVLQISDGVPIYLKRRPEEKQPLREFGGTRARTRQARLSEEAWGSPEAIHRGSETRVHALCRAWPDPLPLVGPSLSLAPSSSFFIKLALSAFRLAYPTPATSLTYSILVSFLARALAAPFLRPRIHPRRRHSRRHQSFGSVDMVAGC